MKKLYAVGAAVGGSLVSAASSFAAFSIPAGSVADLAPVEAWLGVAVVAYLALFGYRKFVKTAGRS